MSDPTSPIPNRDTPDFSQGHFPAPDLRAAQPERRLRRRAMASIPVRIRCSESNGTCIDEVSTTVNVTRLGFLFLTQNPRYFRAMEVRVIFPYSKDRSFRQVEQKATVVRISELSSDQCAVAISLVIPDANEESAATETPASQAPQFTLPNGGIESGNSKPLVLILDSEPTLLDAARVVLGGGGYEVIAVNNARDGHEVLKLFTPALVIAEIEGDGFPGLDLCAHVKATSRLQRVPVVLVTRAGNPSDYSSAHSVGAIVCMAKPFKNERLLHVARLLSPPISQPHRN